MTAVPEGYVGREHSYIKHRFLTEYLQSAAYKILQKRSPTFNYVDAFAGPWQLTEGNEFSDASFHQAVQRLETVRSDLARTGLDGLSVRSFFCEKRTHAVEQLRDYAKQHKSLSISVYEGKFEDNLPEIAAACMEGFTFTFIDPTGWNIRSDVVFDFLVRMNGEFLLNFMAEHINRHAGYSGVTASIGLFLADPDWETDFANCPREWSNETCVLHLLKEKMKARRVATYLPDMAIKRPTQERVKMRLVLGTHVAKGVEVFRDVQHRVEQEEMEIRTDLRLRADHRSLLFSPAHLAATQQEREGVGSAPNRVTAEESVKETLRQKQPARFDGLATTVMEHIPVRMTNLKALLVEMKKRGVVVFELPERARVPRPETLIWLS